MKFIAYETVPAEGFDITSAPHRRGWMDTTHDRSAYRCLPMLLANQAGWEILNPATVRIKWNGGPLLNAIDIERWQAAALEAAGDDYIYPSSHFGVGVITWTIPYLFRTPPGWNLLVRGPANQPKDGCAPLEGLVETDWTAASFTMNWKLTRPDTWITFEKGEPICMIVPQRRHELEEFSTEIASIGDNPELQAAYTQWCESRDTFNTERRNPASDAARKGWEKHYFQGSAPDGASAAEHQTKLRLHQFVRASPELDTRRDLH